MTILRMLAQVVKLKLDIWRIRREKKRLRTKIRKNEIVLKKRIVAIENFNYAMQKSLESYDEFWKKFPYGRRMEFVKDYNNFGKAFDFRW